MVELLIFRFLVVGLFLRLVSHLLVELILRFLVVGLFLCLVIHLRFETNGLYVERFIDTSIY